MTILQRIGAPNTGVPADGSPGEQFWHAIPAPDALALQGSHPEGLSGPEAERRRASTNAATEH